jgi:hypothetical protein
LFRPSNFKELKLSVIGAISSSNLVRVSLGVSSGYVIGSSILSIPISTLIIFLLRKVSDDLHALKSYPLVYEEQPVVTFKELPQVFRGTLKCWIFTISGIEENVTQELQVRNLNTVTVSKLQIFTRAIRFTDVGCGLRRIER